VDATTLERDGVPTDPTSFATATTPAVGFFGAP